MSNIFREFSMQVLSKSIYTFYILLYKKYNNFLFFYAKNLRSFLIPNFFQFVIFRLTLINKIHFQ